VNEENRRTATSFGKRDAGAAPFEPAFFTTDEIGELVDAFSGKRVVRSGGADNGAARESDLSPAILATVHRCEL